MAVVSVNEIYEDRSSSEDSDGEHHTRAWKVRLSSENDGPRLARSAPGIARLGDFFPGGGFAICSDVTADPEGDSPLVFRVVANYEYPSGVAGEEANEDGTTQPTFKIGQAQQTRAYTADVNGAALVASNGQPFDPPVEDDEAITTITIEGRVPFEKFSPAVAETYRDKYNNDELFGYKAFQIKTVEVGGSTTDGGFWDVSISLYIKDDWRIKIIDQGTYTATTTLPNPGSMDTTIAISDMKRITDGRGVPADGPVLLDGNGQKLENGKAVLRGPFQLKSQVSVTALLTQLGFPTTIAGYKRV